MQPLVARFRRVITRNVDAMRKLFAKFDDAGVNMPSLPGIFPDYPAPIVRNDEAARGWR